MANIFFKKVSRCVDLYMIKWLLSCKSWPPKKAEKNQTNMRLEYSHPITAYYHHQPGILRKRFTNNDASTTQRCWWTIHPALEMGDKNHFIQRFSPLSLAASACWFPRNLHPHLTFRTSFLAKFAPVLFVTPPATPKEMVQEQILPEIDKQLPKMLRGSVSFPKVPPDWCRRLGGCDRHPLEPMKMFNNKAMSFLWGKRGSFFDMVFLMLNLVW